MKSMCQFVILVFVLYFCEQIDSASVDVKRSIVGDGRNAALFVSGQKNANSFCDTYTDFTPRQREICRNEMLLIGSVLEGARLARKECAKQFKNERWDCSNIAGKSTALGLMTKYATREAAFNYALVTAGIVHVMARNCMKGDLPSCHCSQAKRPKSLAAKNKWGGCGDNIQYASVFSETFLDDPKILGKLNGSTSPKFAKKVLMDDHNKQVGRQAVFKNRRTECKCHGATSHCTIKTCWYQVREFNVIGKYLKTKYHSAVKASLDRKNGKKDALKLKNNNQLSNNKLVYTDDSPSYCKKTVGRLCSTTIDGPGSCEYLCCGRGSKTEYRVITKNCRCRFEWCCYVKCDVCKETVQVHICI